MTVLVEEKLYDCRDAFAVTLEGLAEADESVIAVVNDSVGSSKLGRFAERFPSRLINVGIAEQNLIGIAAGLSSSGKRPFASAAACFMTARALEQIKVDLAYSNANVTLCAMSPGVAYGELGPTHHSIEDVAWLRALPNMVVVVPADPLETAQALVAAAEHKGPMFVRVSRMGVPNVHPTDYRFTLGKAFRLREGRDLTIIANGTMLARALAAADALAAEGIAARIVGMPTVRPLDVDEILAAAEETGAIVTVEEHTIYGGLGSAVAEAVVVSHPVPMRIMGIPGVFAPTGSAEFLLEHFGLTAEGIRAAALQLLERRSRG